MKADSSFIKSQQRVHRAAVERAENLASKDPLIKAYIDTIAEHMRVEPQERPVDPNPKGHASASE